MKKYPKSTSPFSYLKTFIIHVAVLKSRCNLIYALTFFNTMILLE